MTTLRVTMIDDKPAVFLPEGLGMVEGAEVSFEGGVLRVKGSESDEQFQAMASVMQRREDVLRRLAE
jgi:hypothetical protein